MKDFRNSPELNSIKGDKLIEGVHLSELLIFTVVLITVSAQTANARWLEGVDTYNDCVIENTKSVTVKSAIMQIRNACADKFSVPLTSAQKSKISGTAKISPFQGGLTSSLLATKIQFNLYNGISEIHITEIDVQIKFSSENTRIYKLSVGISPLNEIEHVEDINMGEHKNFEYWEIVSAKGFNLACNQNSV
jgi:hypothetical protein